MPEDMGGLEMYSLVTDTKFGEQASMTHLTELVEDDLRSYIYRITLNPELTQDILQETLLHMVTSLNQLKRADRSGRGF